MNAKLYSLKSWLTVEEAALHLSSIISEEVSLSDILQLGLEGHLKLSVNLVNKAYIRKGEVKDLMETPVMLYMHNGRFPLLNSDENVVPGSIEEECRNLSRKPYGQIIEQCSDELARAVAERRVLAAPLGDHVKGNDYVRFSGGIIDATGIWDLPMLAGERISIEERYQILTGGPEVELTNIDGTWLEADGCLYCIYERFDQDYISEVLKRDGVKPHEHRYSNPEHFYPVGRLPDDMSVVVRRENLDAFIYGLENTSKTSQPSERDEIRALEALGLLAETFSRSASKYDLSGKPNKAQIAEAMSNHAGDIYGMSKSKLQRLLTDSLNAWDERRG